MPKRWFIFTMIFKQRFESSAESVTNPKREVIWEDNTIVHNLNKKV